MQTVHHHGRTTAYRQIDSGEGISGGVGVKGESESGGAGTTATVLFVHGSGGTHAVWRAQYRRHGRQQKGRRENGGRYQAVGLDLSGHGKSDDIDTDPGAETLDAYAADVRAVADSTGANVLVGNSLGGAVLMHYVLEHDATPAGLVLAGTGAKLAVHPDILDRFDDDFSTVIDLLHRQDYLFHNVSSDRIEHSKAIMMDVGRAVTERDFRSCHTFDVRDRLDEIGVPTLAVVGEHDRLTPPEYHEYLASSIPNGSLVTISAAAHLAMVERPAAFNNALDRFLETL